MSVIDPDTTGSTLTMTIDEANSGEAVNDFNFDIDSKSSTDHKTFATVRVSLPRTILYF